MNKFACMQFYCCNTNNTYLYIYLQGWGVRKLTKLQIIRKKTNIVIYYIISEIVII